MCLVVDLFLDVVFRAKQAPELHDDDKEHEEDLHDEGRDGTLLKVRTDIVDEDTFLCLCQHRAKKEEAEYMSREEHYAKDPARPVEYRVSLLPHDAQGVRHRHDALRPAGGVALHDLEAGAGKLGRPDAAVAEDGAAAQAGRISGLVA